MLENSVHRSRDLCARRMISVLSAAAALLAAVALAAAQTPAASAQMPANFNTPPDNYGGAMNYGTYVETYGTTSSFGAVPYSNYVAAAGRTVSYGAQVPLISNRAYSVSAASSAPSTSARYSGAVGLSWIYCTIPGGGPTWVPAGSSTAGLLC